MQHKRCVILGLLVAAFIFILDQGSKWLMLEAVGIATRPPIEVLPFFDLVMVWNYGISFGMFAGGSPMIWVALSSIIMLILLLWLVKTDSRLYAGALGAVLGGAAGNVADRLRFGAVADFFDFHLGSYHWPAFNIADAAIFIGVVLLCAGSMFRAPHHDHKENNP